MRVTQPAAGVGPAVDEGAFVVPVGGLALDGELGPLADEEGDEEVLEVAGPGAGPVHAPSPTTTTAAAPTQDRPPARSRPPAAS